MKFNVKTFLTTLTAVTPMLLLVIPGGAELAPFAAVLVAGIADAQKKPGATGAAKKAYVLQLVADAAAGANVVRPGTVKVDVVVDASGHAIDAIIGTIQIVEQARQAQPSVPALVPAL